MSSVEQGSVAALGEHALVEGYGLAGALVVAADTDAEVRRAWAALPCTVAVVVLTARAGAVLGPALRATRSPMSVVMP